MKTRTMKLTDIKISKAFANSVPSESKMQECRYNWDLWHCQDRYVVVNQNNVLVDGYIQYLVLKENDINEVQVKIKNKSKNRKNMPHYKEEPTTYIYGTHNNKSGKEFVWRIPKSWSEVGWQDGLNIGDKVLVKTKFGVKPVVITKIDTLNKCPVDMPVKKVVKKLM